MTMDQFYLYVSCQDSNLESDHAGDFSLILPKTYYMEGEWECALTELTMLAKSEMENLRFYICCDIVEESYAKGILFPVLRTIGVNQSYVDLEFAYPYYLKIKQSKMSRIRMSIRGDGLQPIRFKADHLHCTLHFRWGQ